MAYLHLQPLPPRTTRSELIAFLGTVGGVSVRQVGRVDLRGNTAVVEVPVPWIARLVQALDGVAWKDRRLRAWTTAAAAPSGHEEDHFQRLIRLLEVEAAAEARQVRERSGRLSPGEAERAGNALVDLVVVDESSGLGGRCLLTLVKRNRSLPLPWTRLQVGSPVLLSCPNAPTEESTRGVVCERTDRRICVALDEPPADADASTTYRLDLAGDEVARLRQRTALERARAARGDRLAELRQVLLGEVAPAFGPDEEFVPLSASLNTAQQEAVHFALASQDLAIIHGPPGTGKTTTVVELIRQAVRRGEKVLACAPSNLAVDNLLERLVAAGERVVRLGHPARVLPTLQDHTLDVLTREHADVRQARKFAKEAFALFRKARKYTRAKPEPGARRDQRQEARELLAEARRLERQAVERVIDAAAVLCSTTTALDSEILGQRRFDLAVVDEACQTTEPGAWVPLQRCRRVVLAGDHCQLPPTVLSPEAAAEGFGISLLERLAGHFGPAVTRRLDVQYRMHEAIMRFSSEEFYDSALEADPSVRGHLLTDLPGVRPDLLTETPIQFIDTAGASFDEQVEAEGESRFNPQEGRLVARKVRALLELGVAPGDVAVIAPYSAQVRWLRDAVAVPGLEIDSVDGFQGREKECVVVSLVRSNSEGEIGFLADVRRTNVALTRARRKLLLIGDSATLSSHPFYQKLFTYLEAAGAYHSVWEESEQD